MPLSAAQRETPKRDWLLPPDLPANHEAQEADRVIEGKGEKSVPRPDELKQKPTPSEATKQPQDAGKPPPKRMPKWPLALGALVLALFVGLVLWMIFRPDPDVWTNDAYVRVHYASIAPRISGQVTHVPVDDNDAVKAGQEVRVSFSVTVPKQLAQ